MERLKSFAKSFQTDFFQKFFAAWFASSAIMFLKGNNVIALGNVNIVSFIIIFIASFALFQAMNYRNKGCIYTLLALSVLIFSCLLIVQSNNIYTYIALAVIFVLSVKHFFDKGKSLRESLPKRSYILLLSLSVLFFFAILTATSVLRYKTYSAPNYDFGIFCNMFYNMKESFRPLVSCERDQILSHFAVHFSPAMYIFLPIYFIFPSPVTVAVCQTAAIASGVIPFILIMQSKNIKRMNICLLATVYMANAAYTGGCMYDFHENCLLPVFLMWMFYFYEKKKLPLMFLFALLTLTVKEDAFIYVAVFATFIIFEKKEYPTGAFLASIAVAYFAFATFILKNYGTGIMSDRFASMIEGDDGLMGIVKTVFTNLGYTVKQIFGTQDETPLKLVYFLQLMFPLAFIPFLTKKPMRLILILPILLNLLTDYPYQYNINFQYGFGLMSLLLYLSVLNIEDMKPKKRDFACLTASGLAVIMFFSLIIPTFTHQAKLYSESKEMYAEMDEVLEKIPNDAKVAASTFLIPHLSDREEIYEVYYTAQTDFDYIVLDMRSGYKEESLEKAAEYEQMGYELYDCSSGYIFIYKNAD